MSAHNEGYKKGKADKLGRYHPDVHRWIKEWPTDFAEFEKGYNAGHLETVIPMNEQHILDQVGKALAIQFDSTYSWHNMIDDTESLSDEEKQWAKEHISFKAYITEPEKKKIVCVECGSDNVAINVWIHANTGGDEGEGPDDAWCNNCGVHRKLEEAKP